MSFDNTVTGQYLSQFPPLHVEYRAPFVHRLDRPSNMLRNWSWAAVIIWTVVLVEAFR